MRPRRGRKTNAQEIPPGPPKRKDKKDGEDETGDLARIGVESARDERCADQARAEVSRREGEPGYPARHGRRASLVGCARAHLSIRIIIVREGKKEKTDTHDRARWNRCVRT